MNTRLVVCLLTLVLFWVASASDAQDVEKYQKLVAKAQFHIATMGSGEAPVILDELLREPNEIVIEVTINKKTVKVTVHAEAERLLKSMPNKGRAAYEQLVGDKARDLLKAAEKDEKKLQELSRAYLFSNAGSDGTERLAAVQHDAGRAKEAVATYVRLLNARPLDKLTPPTLFRAARACRDADNANYLDAFWFELRRQAPQGFRDGDRFITHEESERELQNPPAKK
jgi:hypothetical protein